jgi:hypothetical protein
MLLMQPERKNNIESNNNKRANVLPSNSKTLKTKWSETVSESSAKTENDKNRKATVPYLVLAHGQSSKQ